ARLRDRHVRRGKVAIGIPRAAVENSRTASPAFAGAPAAHKLPFIAFRAFDSHGDRARVLALRITGAPDEFTEAPVFFHQTVAAKRAFLVQRFIRLTR